jgi:hypothetical protein
MKNEVKPVSAALAAVLNEWREMLDEPDQEFVQAYTKWMGSPFKDYTVEWCNSGGRFDTPEMYCGYLEFLNGDACREAHWTFMLVDDAWYLLAHQTDIPCIATVFAQFLEYKDGRLALNPTYHPELQPDLYEETCKQAEESILQAYERNQSRVRAA